MDTHNDQFRLAEFQSLRLQILENIKAMDQNEIYMLGAVAAVYVLIFQETTAAKLVPMIIWAPCVLVLAGYLRFLALDAIIGTINNYLETKEGTGDWVRFYRKERKPLMRESRHFFWTLVGSVTLVSAIIVSCKGVFWR
jgi:hypothetical protein